MDASDPPQPPASPQPVAPWRRRSPSPLWVLALTASASTLVAATWLVAQLSWQGRLRTLEAEVSFLRRTRHVDLARLVRDLERLAGPAADRLALQDLQRRHAALAREHQTTLEGMAALRQARRLEERFQLSMGATRAVLGGKVPVVLEGLEGEGASVSLAGGAASLWRPGDFRDLNFGGGRYRLTLEDRANPSGNGASFRLDALLDPVPSRSP